LILTGCTGETNGDGADGSSSTDTSTTNPSDSPDGGSSDEDTSDNSDNTDAAVPNDSPLMAHLPGELTAESAEAETVRVADEIQAQLDPATILFVDDHPQLIDSTSTAGQYFGVLRILSLTETTDPVLLAKVVAVQLKAAGWSEASVDSTEGSYFVALISTATADEAWVLQLGGDTSAEGNGAITINLISPTFP
jgi:hypothetical protein